ncbi:MAG: DNA methyltransferase, partial [bacterium]
MNKLQPKDQPVHDWYRFVLSFPPHLVDEYVKRFGLQDSETLLDPFCGTGTTIIEAKMLGIPSIGVEAHPMSHFASQVKVDWSVSPDGLLEHAGEVAELATKELEADGIEDAPFFHTNSSRKLKLRKLELEKTTLLLKDSISPLPLHKTLVLIEALNQKHQEPYYRHERLALAKALVFSISNLRFGPEVGIGKLQSDAPVISAWLSEVKKMAHDLKNLQHYKDTKAVAYLADSRQLTRLLKPNTIDAVITSPPYPNEKDYTRTTRLESVLLGFINNHAELQ